MWKGYNLQFYRLREKKTGGHSVNDYNQGFVAHDGSVLSYRDIGQIKKHNFFSVDQACII